MPKRPKSLPNSEMVNSLSRAPVPPIVEMAPDAAHLEGEAA